MKVVKVIFGVLMFVICILMLVGLGLLTPLAFGKQTYRNMNSTQQDLMKMFVILEWFGVGISIISAIIVAFS